MNPRTPAAVATSLILLATAIAVRPALGGPPARPGVPDWLDRVQTYCMVPVLPETAARLHVTANGVWAGIGGPHPVLTHAATLPAVTAKYGSDARAFVDDCHKAGLLVFSVVNGIEGFETLRAAGLDLDAMACRDARGRPARAGKDMMLMCTNNPDWQRWETEQGKRGIDLGADAVFLDTPMGSSFVSGFLRGGFCRHCLANFEKYLRAKYTPQQLEQRFGLKSFDAPALVARLAPLQDLANPKRRPHHNTSPDDLLFREFIACQEQASFDTRRRLVEDLRAYAAGRGRKVAFCTNAADLGTVNPAGHWIRALMFADLFDLFAYEQNVEPDGMPSPRTLPYPRGKWAAYHKLAHAVHGRRAPAVLHAGNMGAVLLDVLLKRKTTNAWMEAQSAEAYAANGAYIQYFVEPRPGLRLLEKCWAGSARHAAFVQEHADLYAGDLRSGSSLAVLFLMNERGRTVPAVCPSYLGFAQALAEGTYPFDVRFAGDGHYVRDRLSADDLRPYQAVLIPSPAEPTANQRQVVRAFVQGGGTLVCQEPGKFGLAGTGAPPAGVPCLASAFTHGKGRVLVLRGTVTSTWTGDVGADFFKSYRPGLRAEVGRLAEALGLARVVPAEQGGLVGAFPIVQPDRERVVLHLVNYDIDDARDAVRAKAGVTVRVARPAFLAGPVTARCYAPGEAPRVLDPRATAAGWEWTLPRLGAYGAVTISRP